MKIGLENKRNVIIAAIAVVCAVGYGVHQFTSGPETPPAAASSTTSARPGVARRVNVVPRSQQRTTAVATPSLDPRLKLDLLRSSEQIAYAGTGRNIFQDQPEAPLPGPKHPIYTPPLPPPQPSGPPPPPPIALKFFGFASRPGEQKQIFLADGEDVFIARQGDIVNRHYKVVEIRSNDVVIRDVLNNNTQNIPLTAS